MRPPFALALVLAASAQAAPLTVTATPGEDGASLSVSVEAPGIPKGALASVQVIRDFPPPSTRDPVVLKTWALPFGEEGRGSDSIPVGDELKVPGLYRVLVSFDPQGQYARVREAVGGAWPAPAEAGISGWTISKAYVKALLEEEAAIESSFTEASEFLVRLAEAERRTAEDREKGLEAWTGWRQAALDGLEARIQHGREVSSRLYPETHERYTEGILYKGLFQMEPRKFDAAQSGKGYLPTGAFHGKPADHPDDPSVLEPFRKLFLQETLRQKLGALNLLYETSSALAARRPAEEIWARKRAEWEAILSLSTQKELEGAAQALRGWWDAEEAALFHPERPEASETEARLKALKSRIQEALPR